MPVPFAINGLGRIGRALVRIGREHPDLQLVAANDLASPDQLARLLAHDTLHGAFDGSVASVDEGLEIDGAFVRTFQEADPSRIPWDRTEARIVIDATGHCKRRDRAEQHLRGDVRKVIVSANATGMDFTICMGVNHREYLPDSHHLLSGASCTTNCLVPLIHLLDSEFGILHATVNTVHSYNNDQSLLEAPHHDPRRARAAALNMIPTTTSAVEAAERILPKLQGRLDGLAVRVPTPNVSLLDLVVTLEGAPSVDRINGLFVHAAEEDLRGFVATTDEELVSSDFLRHPASAIVDLNLTRSVGDRLYRVVAWYDNEWAHASRLVDLLRLDHGF